MIVKLNVFLVFLFFMFDSNLQLCVLGFCRSKLLDIINKASVQSVPEKKDNVEMSDDSASNFEATPRRLRMNLKTRQKSKKVSKLLKTDVITNPASPP